MSFFSCLLFYGFNFGVFKLIWLDILFKFDFIVVICCFNFLVEICKVFWENIVYCLFKLLVVMEIKFNIDWLSFVVVCLI